MKSKTLSLLISLSIISFLLYKSDTQALLTLFWNVDLLYLSLGVLIFLPTVLIPALRWKYIVSDHLNLPMLESIRLILASSTFNMFLPSKAGDLLKAFFIEQKGVQGTRTRDLVTRVIYEKMLDFVGLTFNLWFGLLFFTAWNTTTQVVALLSLVVILLFILLHLSCLSTVLNRIIPSLRGLSQIKAVFIDINLYAAGLKMSKIAPLLFVSTFIWWVHMFQFFVFFKMFHFQTTLLDIMVRMPIAIYFGLLPLTIGGIGTRDAAIVSLFSSQIGYEGCVAMGMMGTFRYIVPAILGSFFVFNYIKNMGRFWRKSGNKGV
ncbi:MAG: flippase-like domain-containing protein [Deltaproteobacteria bacterium]|nr:flippase-like domain-containing protein [Deltaproteobacteria bacterium]